MTTLAEIKNALTEYDTACKVNTGDKSSDAWHRIEASWRLSQPEWMRGLLAIAEAASELDSPMAWDIRGYYSCAYCGGQTFDKSNSRHEDWCGWGALQDALKALEKDNEE